MRERFKTVLTALRGFAASVGESIQKNGYHWFDGFMDMLMTLGFVFAASIIGGVVAACLTLLSLQHMGLFYWP